MRKSWLVGIACSLAIQFVSYGQEPIVKSSEFARFHLLSQPTPPTDEKGLDPLLESGDDPLAEDDILGLDLGQLSQVNVTAPESLGLEVTSVTRSASTVGRSPAAIFVITNEMIKHAAARTVPEILRMVPGVNVQRISGTRWAIGIRGFNGRFANKLLVQIDGRNVYSPLFGGTYWDEQDLILEDIERIEVIRGPGATVWGENAVNGIINIITKNAKDTQGTYVNVGAGDEWQSFASARVGGAVAKNAYLRTYAKWQERENGYSTNGLAEDDSRMGRGGFRLDWEPSCCDAVTLQGDYYGGQAGGRQTPPIPMPPFSQIQNNDEDLVGGNVLARWTHRIDEETSWSARFYYDRTSRDAVTFGSAQNRDTLDFDFQYETVFNDIHKVVVGASYRYTDDNIRNNAVTQILPTTRPLDMFNYFIQDEITLVEDQWYFLIGSKFGHNDFTGFEMQPTARLLFLPNQRSAVWGSVSRAVRLPSRLETDTQILLNAAPGAPVFLSVEPLGNLDAEDLLAYEFGMRGQPNDWFYWDLALFYNEYTDIIGFQINGPPGAAMLPPGFIGAGIPVSFNNNRRKEETWGGELASTVNLTEDWTMRLAYSYFRGRETLGFDVLNYPRNLIYLQSSQQLTCDLDLDLIFRYQDVLRGDPTGAIPTPPVSPYFVMDAQLTWRAFKDAELYLVGRNLLDNLHQEAPTDPSGGLVNYVEREFYGGISIRY